MLFFISIASEKKQRNMYSFIHSNDERFPLFLSVFLSNKASTRVIWALDWFKTRWTDDSFCYRLSVLYISLYVFTLLQCLFHFSFCFCFQLHFMKLIYQLNSLFGWRLQPVLMLGWDKWNINRMQKKHSEKEQQVCDFFNVYNSFYCIVIEFIILLLFYLFADDMKLSIAWFNSIMYFDRYDKSSFRWIKNIHKTSRNLMLYWHVYIK